MGEKQQADVSLPPWLEEPRRVWSLLQMIEFFAKRSADSLVHLSAVVIDTMDQIAASGPAAELPEAEKVNTGKIARLARDVCADIGLADAMWQADELYSRCTWSPVMGACNYQLVHADAKRLYSMMMSGLAQRRFAAIPKDRHEFFEQENLFRLPRPSPFPSAEEDIKDAGNAYAAELHTATVYHSMRATEIALRAFARHLRVKIPKKKSGGRMVAVPLEWAVWEDILGAAGKAVEQRCLKGGQPAEVGKRRAFYRGALSDFMGIRDIYRNEVMHVRKRYDHHEAASALERVGGFLRRLGDRVQE